MKTLTDLQSRIDARATQTAEQAWQAFWKKHQADSLHRHDQGIEGVTTVDLAKHIKEAVENDGNRVSNIEELTCGAHVHKVLLQYGELLRLAVYHNEKARLEGELLEMAEKLNAGFLEE